MGCGYGTLGVVIQKLNPSCSVVSVDVNPRAVELTGINSQQNGLDLNAFVSDGFEYVEGTFDHIVSNPPIRAGKKVIYKMFEDAYMHLNEGGLFTIVIRKQQGAESAVKKLNEIFNNCEVIDRDKGYWILQSSKLTG